MKRVATCVAVGSALLCIFPAASGAAEHEHHHASAIAADALTEGTVKKIDKAAGKITLAHGPIVNLGMSGMTMPFKAKEAKLLDGLKEGDKVRFRAEDVGGALVVVRIEAVK